MRLFLFRELLRLWYLLFNRLDGKGRRQGSLWRRLNLNRLAPRYRYGDTRRGFLPLRLISGRDGGRRFLLLFLLRFICRRRARREARQSKPSRGSRRPAT
jgi:hypothetical protein